MEFFVDLIGTVFPYIRTAFLAILPLGFLIFIHELGHFYAAKRCGIKVNTFSLGFGPKLFGVQRGETEYRISLLPFGGYVQMEGENPSEQTGAPGEFASASLGHRALVVAAGPAVNLLFGVLVYWGLFTIGLNEGSERLIGTLTGAPLGETEAVEIGWVADDGPGAAGELKPGDRLVSVNGKPVRHWGTFHTYVLLGVHKELEIVVEREGGRHTLFATPKPKSLRTARGDVGELQVAAAQKTVVRHISEGGPAAQAGIQIGDILESLNGERLYNVPAFGYGTWHPSAGWIEQKHQALYGQINENPEMVTVDVLRDNEEPRPYSFRLQWGVRAYVQKDSYPERAGIQDKDVLVTLNGEPIDLSTFYARLKAVADQPIEIGLIRDGDLKHVTLTNPVEGSDPDLDTPPFGLVWQATLSGMQLEPYVSLPRYNVISAFGKGLEMTGLTLTAVGHTLRQLVGGEVSPKYLAGPIGIVDTTSRMFSGQGISSVLFFIGFISINLCIVNLLPIPIADGGHLLFFALEKLRGKPMPRRAQEIVQQVSVVLLIALFLYITWFDGLEAVTPILERIRGN